MAKVKSRKLKVVTVVGTRPEIIRLSRVISKLNETTDHVLVHTGQNYDYELNDIFFDDLEIKKPDIYLDAAGKTPCETIANIIKKADEGLEDLKPDSLLILGDTNSCLVAYAAKRRKIPVFHMEAGNRCYDERTPEEINRKIIDHLADINMPYSDLARENLIREGLPPDRIIKTGSPLGEVFRTYSKKAAQSDVLEKLSCNSLTEIKERGFYLVSCHREENTGIEEGSDGRRVMDEFISLLHSLHEHKDTYIILTCHPRTYKAIREGRYTLPSTVMVCKPFCYTDYLHLQKYAKAVLSDSGSLAEEASLLNQVAICIRDTHERPAGMENAATIMTGMNWERVSQALNLVEYEYNVKMHPDYDVITNVSQKVVRIIHSYTDYVRRNVWKE